MPKKLLIVEPSVTVQKLFSTTLSHEDYHISFVQDSREALIKLTEILPDVLLVNAESPVLDGFELTRIVKKIKCFVNLPVGLYATSPLMFDKLFIKEAGANSFTYLDSRTLEFVVEELAQIPSGKKVERSLVKEATKECDDEHFLSYAADLWKADRYRSAILNRLLTFIPILESSTEMISHFLSLSADLGEAPLAALYVIEHDGPHFYYIGEDSIEKNEVSDFFKVCAHDFEKNHTDINISHVESELLKSNTDLLRFYTKEIKLSSYECIHLLNHKGRKFASLHLVRGGNFTENQLDAIHFACDNAGIILENALKMKRKSFYEQRIRKAFSRFVPAEIIDELASKDSQQDIAVGENRKIAILFSDIRSFTNISEKNKPDVMVAFLNRYFTIMVDIIKKYGGTIDKFIGDAIMAEFGTPISYEDNARRAAMAGYEMRQVLPDVPLGDLILPEGMKFDIGIGIHYGEAIVGSIGSKDKTDYSVIGDAVNLASRLEGLTKTYGVQLIVSNDMKENIIDDGNPDGFIFRHLDDVRGKGKKKAVPIFAIDRNAEEFSPEYRESYIKGMELYQQGIFRLAKDYFLKASEEKTEDKAAKLMLSRCEEFIENPPKDWDGAISYTTK